MTTAPNFPMLVSALGWVDDRKWSARRRQLCHELLARMVQTGEPLVEFSKRDRQVRVPGNHGWTERVLADLTKRGVVARGGPRGPLPELVGLEPRVYRWDVPWAMRRSEVLVRLEAFSRSVWDSNGSLTGPGAAPGPQGHTAGQGQPQVRANGKRTRGSPRPSSGGQAGQGQPQAQAPEGDAVLSSLDDVVVRRDHDDDEAFLTLRAAIAQHADGVLYPGSRPELDLRRLAAGMNGHLERALQVVEQLGAKRTRSPVVYVATIAELLGDGAEGQALLERRRLEDRLAQLAGLRSVDERWETEATEIEAKLGTL